MTCARGVRQNGGENRPRWPPFCARLNPNFGTSSAHPRRAQSPYGRLALRARFERASLLRSKRRLDGKSWKCASPRPRGSDCGGRTAGSDCGVRLRGSDCGAGRAGGHCGGRRSRLTAHRGPGREQVAARAAPGDQDPHATPQPATSCERRRTPAFIMPRPPHCESCPAHPPRAVPRARRGRSRSRPAARAPAGGD